MSFAEVAAAVLLGGMLLWMVLDPLVRGVARPESHYEPEELSETSRGVALTALRELELDRETGKLSDADYQALKTTYTAEAVVAMRRDAEPDIEAIVSARVRAFSEPPPAFCSACGARAEPDGIFCSSCGARLAA